jgi:hypothetical protein
MQDFQVDKLGPYPLLQLAGAILVLCGLALAIYRASRDRPAPSAVPQIPQEQRWFFDGPLSIAVNLLRDIRNHADRLVEIFSSVPEESRKHSDLLRQQIELLKEISGKLDEMPSRRPRR